MIQWDKWQTDETAKLRVSERSVETFSEIGAPPRPCIPSGEARCFDDSLSTTSHRDNSMTCVDPGIERQGCDRGLGVSLMRDASKIFIMRMETCAFFNGKRRGT